jgi:predicted secreted protein
MDSLLPFIQISNPWQVISIGDTLNVSVSNPLITETTQIPSVTVTTYCLTTVIDEINKKEDNSIQLYPNPTSGTFTLIYNSSSIIYNSNITIFDVTGRKVYTQSIINPQSTIINISDLSTGIYYWEMMSNQGIEGTGKIVLIKD